MCTSISFRCRSNTTNKAHRNVPEHEKASSFVVLLRSQSQTLLSGGGKPTPIVNTWRTLHWQLLKAYQIGPYVGTRAQLSTSLRAHQSLLTFPCQMIAQLKYILHISPCLSYGFSSDHTASQLHYQKIEPSMMPRLLHEMQLFVK